MPLSPAPQRPPVYYDAAEQLVLGGFMLNIGAWFEVANIVAAGDFYRPRHRVIFEAMEALGHNYRPLDAVTIADAIKVRGLLDKIGGIPYLADLVGAKPRGANVAAYARIVRKWSVLRPGPADCDK